MLLVVLLLVRLLCEDDDDRPDEVDDLPAAQREDVGPAVVAPVTVSTNVNIVIAGN